MINIYLTGQVAQKRRRPRIVLSGFSDKSTPFIVETVPMSLPPKKKYQAYLTKKHAKTGVVLSECRKTLTREKVVAVGFRRFVRVFEYP
jgi:hypothetical protein